MTKTEEYINQAVEKAKEELGGHSLTGCTFTMHMEADGATKTLAEALKAQAMANESSSDAMLALANSLKPKDACMVRIDHSGVHVAGSEEYDD